MNPKLLFCLALTLSGAFGLAGQQNGEPIDVKSLSLKPINSIFDILSHNPSVYVCTIIKTEPEFSNAEAGIGGGKITLSVSKTLLGKEREKLILGYGWPGVMGGQSIWPDLNTLGQTNLLWLPNPNDKNKYVLKTVNNSGKTNLLCVVIPHAVAWLAPQIAGGNDAADYVVPVRGLNDPSVTEMEAICKLYQIQSPAELKKTLTRALRDPRQMVRDYALQLTVMRLGRTDPDGAIKILQSLASKCKTARASLDAQRLIQFMACRFFGHIGTWKLPAIHQFLCRCCIVFAQARSKIVRNDAIFCLAREISIFRHAVAFSAAGCSLRDGLTASDKTALTAVLDPLENVSNTNIIAAVHEVRKWLTDKPEPAE